MVNSILEDKIICQRILSYLNSQLRKNDPDKLTFRPHSYSMNMNSRQGGSMLEKDPKGLIEALIETGITPKRK